MSDNQKMRYGVKGWKNVFAFTYTQGIKAKSFKISTAVMGVLLIIIVLGMNLLPLLSGGITKIFPGAEEQELSIKTIYISNNTGINLNFSEVNNLKIEVIEIGANELPAVREEVKAAVTPKILVHITKAEGGYYITAERPADADVIEASECEIVNTLLHSALEDARLLALGVSRENLENAKAPVTTAVTVAGELPESAHSRLVKYVIPLVLSIMLFMFVFTHGVTVAQAIAGEKTSKVMELLLTSVSPLAVILGKVLASLLVSLTQVLILTAAVVLTQIISAPFGVGRMIFTAASDPETMSELSNIDPASVYSGVGSGDFFLIFLIFILGFIFYALLAGLVGAGVSRPDDLQSALQPLSLIGVFGFYLAYFPTVFNFDGEKKNFFVTLSHCLPVSSPFALPPSILSGDIGILGITVGIIILAVSDFLLLLLIAAVYERVILYSGSRIGIRAILRMIRN